MWRDATTRTIHSIKGRNLRASGVRLVTGASATIRSPRSTGSTGSAGSSASLFLGGRDNGGEILVLDPAGSVQDPGQLVLLGGEADVELLFYIAKRLA